jgi:hypothetical protein
MSLIRGFSSEREEMDKEEEEERRREVNNMNKSERVLCTVDDTKPLCPPPSSGDISIRLDKTVSRLSCPIPVGAYYMNRSIACKVRYPISLPDPLVLRCSVPIHLLTPSSSLQVFLEVNWSHNLDLAPSLSQILQSLSSTLASASETDGAGEGEGEGGEDDSEEASEQEEEDFAPSAPDSLCLGDSPRIDEVTLRIFPARYMGTLVRPKVPTSLHYVSLSLNSDFIFADDSPPSSEHLRAVRCNPPAEICGDT